MNEVTRIRPDVEVEEATTLPNNIEAEQQLLGAILTNNDTYDRISSIVQPEHFYDPVHARIFQVAADRIKLNSLASPVTLKAFLEDDEGLKELGGPVYLTRLAGAAISSLVSRDYAQLIYDLAIRRELIRLGADISEKACRVDVNSTPTDQIVEAEQALYGLGEKGRINSGFQSFLKSVTGRHPDRSRSSRPRRRTRRHRNRTEGSGQQTWRTFPFRSADRRGGVRPWGRLRSPPTSRSTWHESSERDHFATVLKVRSKVEWSVSSVLK